MLFCSSLSHCGSLGGGGALALPLGRTGTGDSGKSTFLKQMRLLHGTPYTSDELLRYKTLIYHNIWTGIKALIEASKTLGIEVDDQDLAAELFAVDDDTSLTAEQATKMEKLWKDKGIRAAYDRRNEFQLNDSTSFYLTALARIAKPSYKPTDQDVLRSRVATVGAVTLSFQIDGYEFRITDVGGQRNERKKWSACRPAPRRVRRR